MHQDEPAQRLSVRDAVGASLDGLKRLVDLAVEVLKRLRPGEVGGAHAATVSEGVPFLVHQEVVMFHRESGATAGELEHNDGENDPRHTDPFRAGGGRITESLGYLNALRA